ncbi:hypothetical protein [Paraburkholderia dipogonis]|uniref:hypothetical protein n=1 Tax=Paraburkholderia dipogonis TaxID=1211383 RepID=UPI00406BD747
MRVLQERNVVPLVGTRAIPVDLRIVLRDANAPQPARQDRSRTFPIAKICITALMDSC